MDRRDEILTQKVLDRWSVLKTLRLPKEPVWQECGTYVSPYRQLFSDDGVAYKPKDKKLFDDTASESKDTFVNGMFGYMVSPNLYWMQFLMRQEQYQDLPGVRAWLQAKERAHYSLYATSNFYPENLMVLDEEATFGTGVMFVDESTWGTRYIAVPIDRMWLSEGPRGIDTAYRALFPSVRKIAAEFGKDAIENQEQKLHDNPEEKVKVLHAMMPNDDYDPDSLASSKKRYLSIYLTPDGRILRKGGTRKFRYAVLRYKRVVDDAYGVGPTELKLDDIRTANLICKDLLQASNLSVKPPVERASENRGVLKLNPGAINTYQDPNRRTFPINLVGEYPYGQERLAAVQKRIRDGYHVDAFQLFASIDRNKTATEVSELAGERAANMGSITGNMSEYLSQEIEITDEIETRGGRMPSVPIALANAAGAAIDIDYIGPLPQAQKRFLGTRGLISGLSQVLPLTKYDPTVIDVLNLGASARRIMEDSGAPQEAINDPELVKKIQIARAKRNDAIQQAQLGLAAAKVYPGMAKAAEPGSPAQVADEEGAPDGRA